MKIIQKTAKTFLREFGKEITIQRLSEALSRRGYVLLYMGSDDGNEQLLNLGLLDHAKGKKAFTVCTSLKIVFVDIECHNNDKIKLILHELAHIELGHIGNEFNCRDEVAAEIEADAVVYAVLNPPDTTRSGVMLLMVTIILLIFAMILIFVFQKTETISGSTAAAIPAPIESALSNTAEQIEEQIADENVFVYVTPSGNCYHTPECRYAQSDNAIKIERPQAEKNYKPCKICNP